MPWWAALLTAVGLTTIGYAIDAGNKGLTNVFAGFYIAGCVVAVLAVRRKDLFTAVIQPPLILFCAVPAAYWLFHGGKVGHLKDLLINCGYPLIERFPLMLGAVGVVLLIGLIRWYLDAPHRTAQPNTKSFTSVIAAKLNSIVGIDSPQDDAEERPAAGTRRTRATARTAASSTAGATRNRRSTTRSRSGQQAVEREVVERARRRRQAAPRDSDPADSPRRSRQRPRPPRQEAPRESRTRRNPYEPYERMAPHRGGRFDGSEFLFSDFYADMYQPPREPRHERARQHDRPPEHVIQYPPYQPYAPFEAYPPYEPPRRRRASGGPNTNPTHHPISRVRYRGSASANEPESRDAKNA